MCAVRARGPGWGAAAERGSDPARARREAEREGEGSGEEPAPRAAGVRGRRSPRSGPEGFGRFLEGRFPTGWRGRPSRAPRLAGWSQRSGTGSSCSRDEWCRPRAVSASLVWGNVWGWYPDRRSWRSPGQHGPPPECRSQNVQCERVSALVVPVRDRAIAVESAPVALPRLGRVGRDALIAAVLAGLIASLILSVGPPGVDAAAHLYHTRAFEEQGWRIWDNYWYAGRYDLVNYSVLYYPLAAALGQATVAVGAVIGCAAAFALLAHRLGGRQPQAAIIVFAVVWPTVLIAGQYPFGLGMLAALVSLLLWLHGRPLAGLLAAVAALLASPLAFLFLAIVLAGCAVSLPRPLRLHAHARWRRRACCWPVSARSSCCGSSRAAGAVPVPAARPRRRRAVLRGRRDARAPQRPARLPDRPARRLPRGQRRRRDLPERRRRQRRAPRRVHLAAHAAAPARRPPLPPAPARASP